MPHAILQWCFLTHSKYFTVQDFLYPLGPPLWILAASSNVGSRPKRFAVVYLFAYACMISSLFSTLPGPFRSSYLILLPSSGISFHGITVVFSHDLIGTNGPTTISYSIERILFTASFLLPDSIKVFSFELVTSHPLCYSLTLGETE